MTTLINRFAQAHALPVRLFGELLLVQCLPEPELKTRSGLIIATSKDRLKGTDVGLPLFVRVLVAGEGYDIPDRPGERLPLETQPGSICLVPAASVRRFSVFGQLNDKDQDTIALITESSIQMRWDDEEAFKTYFRVLSGEAS